MPIALRRITLSVACACLTAAPAGAQIRTVDPSSPEARGAAAPAAAPTAASPPTPRYPTGGGGQPETSQPADPYAVGTAPPPPADTAPATQAQPPAVAASRASDDQTYKEGDVINAAENVFGRGAEGLAKLIERVLKDQGRPTAYIAGREAGAAFAVGLRYGSGVLHHRIEGDRPVYWTGPSLGFDIGGNASKTFVLVYNLYDSQDLYHRFPAAEGTAYLVGGFTAAYLRRGDIVLIPIRLGVGWRLGANVGYMNFTDHSKWLPF